MPDRQGVYAADGSYRVTIVNTNGSVPFGSTGQILTSGNGTPEGSITAVVGSLYTNTANGAVYRKTTGSGNTGWTTP